MNPFWGNLSERELKLLNNKGLILINYLSVLVPDILFLIKNKHRRKCEDSAISNIPAIPTISFVNINLLRRLIHVNLWYWGYFYRMGKILKPNTVYEKFYHIQLLTWAGANIFPLTPGGNDFTDVLHYTSTSINFLSFSIMKLLFCKNNEIYKFALLGLVGSVFAGCNNGMGFFERLCVYNSIYTVPNIS